MHELSVEVLWKQCCDIMVRWMDCIDDRTLLKELSAWSISSNEMLSADRAARMIWLSFKQRMQVWKKTARSMSIAIRNVCVRWLKKLASLALSMLWHVWHFRRFKKHVGHFWCCYWVPNMLFYLRSESTVYQFLICTPQTSWLKGGDHSKIFFLSAWLPWFAIQIQ